MSVADTYEVEQLGYGVLWLRCRRCGRIWDAIEGLYEGSWRCPSEPHHDD
jgi:hypothetical protein